MRCTCTDCTRKVSIIGHCNYCDMCFCVVHRLPETHNCTEMDKVKSIAQDANTKQLMKNKLVEKKLFVI